MAVQSLFTASPSTLALRSRMFRMERPKPSTGPRRTARIRRENLGHNG
jgi:hypothetical protein